MAHRPTKPQRLLTPSSQTLSLLMPSRSSRPSKHNSRLSKLSCRPSKKRTNDFDILQGETLRTNLQQVTNQRIRAQLNATTRTSPRKAQQFGLQQPRKIRNLSSHHPLSSMAITAITTKIFVHIFTNATST